MIQKKTVIEYFWVSIESIIDEKIQGQSINLADELTKCFSGYKNYSIESQRHTRSDDGRIQIFYRDDDDLYEIQFLRLRESLPEIAKADGDLVVLHIEEGSSIAESASALYDPLTEMLVLQRNYFGVSSSFIQAYLSILLCPHDSRTTIHLTSIMDGLDNLNRVFHSRIKKVEARVAFEGEPLDIGVDLQNFARYNPASVEISIRAGRSKLAYLQHEAASEQVKLLRNNKSTKKLTVQVQGENDLMWVDLLEDRLKQEITISYNPDDGPVRHFHVFRSLKEKYLETVKNNGRAYFDARKEQIKQKE